MSSILHVGMCFSTDYAFYVFSIAGDDFIWHVNGHQSPGYRIKIDTPETPPRSHYLLETSQTHGSRGTPPLPVFCKISENKNAITSMTTGPYQTKIDLRRNGGIIDRRHLLLSLRRRLSATCFSPGNNEPRTSSLLPSDFSAGPTVRLAFLLLR